MFNHPGRQNHIVGSRKIPKKGISAVKCGFDIQIVKPPPSHIQSGFGIIDSMEVHCWAIAR